jgi:hypothetical protein
LSSDASDKRQLPALIDFNFQLGSGVGAVDRMAHLFVHSENRQRAGNRNSPGEANGLTKIRIDGDARAR